MPIFEEKPLSVETAAERVNPPVPAFPQQPGPPSEGLPAPTAPQATGGSEEKKYGMIGRMAQSLLGYKTEYKENPETGQIETVSSRRKPGEFFRSVLAGAVLGGVLGAREQDFMGGFSAGGAGVKADIERQDKEAFGRAQEQLKGRQEAEKMGMERERLDIEKRREQRELSESEQRNIHLKALTVQANATTMERMMQLRGTSFAVHKAEVDQWKETAAIYRAAGLKPMQRGRESDKERLVEQNPSLISAQWVPVDVQAVQQPDGTTDYELVIEAYDLGSPVTITPGIHKLFAPAFQDFDPNWKENIKVGSKKPADEFLSMHHIYDAWAKKDFDRRKQQLELDLVPAQIDQAKAMAEKLRSEALTEKENRTKVQEFSKAMDAWNAKTKEMNGDSTGAFKTLEPGQQTSIGLGMTDLLGKIGTATDSAGRVLREAQMTPGADTALLQANYTALAQRLDGLSRLATDPILGAASAPGVTAGVESTITQQTMEAADTAIKSFGKNLDKILEDIDLKQARKILDSTAADRLRKEVIRRLSKTSPTAAQQRAIRQQSEKVPLQIPGP